MRDLKPRLFHLTCFLTTGASWNWPLCHLPPNQINKTHKNKERDRCNCGILVSLSLSQQIVLCSLSRLVPHLLRVAGLHSCLPCLSLRHPIPWLLNPRGLPAPAAWTPSLWRCPFGSCTPWQHCCRLSSTAQPPPTWQNPAPASLRLSRHMVPSLRKTRAQPATEAPP